MSTTYLLEDGEGVEMYGLVAPLELPDSNRKVLVLKYPKKLITAEKTAQAFWPPSKIVLLTCADSHKTSKFRAMYPIIQSRTGPASTNLPFSASIRILTKVSVSYLRVRTLRRAAWQRRSSLPRDRQC